MTLGQNRGFQEFQRLCAKSDGALELVSKSDTAVVGYVEIRFSLLVGNRKRAEGGLPLREREEFYLYLPAEYPFDKPSLMVSHKRFAGFPHVTWSRSLCLYQSQLEWNPSDGLYGFFDRFDLWLDSAAMNDMDPPEGPLEPPHYIVSSSSNPLLVSANAPVNAGEKWLGLAELTSHDNYLELTGWKDFAGVASFGVEYAFAVFVDSPLPMEYPQKGKDFFVELNAIGIDETQLLSYLSHAAALASEGKPLHLILGTPMRRAADGTPLFHIAAWVISADDAEGLRLSRPQDSDTNELLEIRGSLLDIQFKILNLIDLTWCKILEDRSEVITRRDISTPTSWFIEKKVLILGCGALGSWVGEIVARSSAAELHLIDNSIVKPGLIVRQNYQREDIGTSKAVALADRVNSVVGATIATGYYEEAWSFLREHSDKLNDYDVIIDCTASSIFQMKLERDWALFGLKTPPFVSLIIDGTANYALLTLVSPSSQSGIWDAYIKLKYMLCIRKIAPNLLDAFYGDSASESLFQPEPGCSDPTFSGSMGDIVANVGSSINAISRWLATTKSTAGGLISQPTPGSKTDSNILLNFPAWKVLETGRYRVCISQQAWKEMRGWIRQSSRLRPERYETGGLLWGLWDDTTQVIWVFDASGPPPDSVHSPKHFQCGTRGTVEEHQVRNGRSKGTSGFVGMWHSHPGMSSQESRVDIDAMTALVSAAGQNQRRALMVIIGTAAEPNTAGIYVYESEHLGTIYEAVVAGEAQASLGDVFK